jgi:uncharacterized phage protein (TIGR01671 family)
MEDRYLYKAKRTDSEEWVVGSLISTPHGGYMIDRVADSRRFRVMINSSTICQCTGLRDKNGKLIWENDIVKKEFFTDYENYANSEEYIGIVEVMDCAWVIAETIKGHKCARPIFESISYSKDVKHFEVIGNVFDNPELLESEGQYDRE